MSTPLTLIPPANGDSPDMTVAKVVLVRQWIDAFGVSTKYDVTLYTPDLVEQASSSDSSGTGAANILKNYLGGTLQT